MVVFFIKGKANFFWQKEIIVLIFYHASFTGIKLPHPNPLQRRGSKRHGFQVLFFGEDLGEAFSFWAFPAAEGRAGRAFRSKSSLYAVGFPLLSLTRQSG